MKLSELSVRRPVFATVISLLLIIFGLVSLQRLAVREYPDIDRPVVSITTTYTGASSAVIETKITQVIEDSIAGIEGILKIESDSEDERSSVRIEFDIDREIDGAANDVRDRVARVLGNLPEVTVEHIGSTSVPGCEGKGVVDLMIPVTPEQLEPVKTLLSVLGFQKQVAPAGHEPWPESRPMRVGSLEHEGTRYNLHVHVIPADSPEVETQRRFRDRLREDPTQRDAYVARKREILAQGITNSGDYSEAKGTVIEGILKKDS